MGVKLLRSIISHGLLLVGRVREETSEQDGVLLLIRRVIGVNLGGTEQSQEHEDDRQPDAELVLCDLLVGRIGGNVLFVALAAGGHETHEHSERNSSFHF